jgi:ribosomal protein S18 acetylase RimI-like enzyme
MIDFSTAPVDRSRQRRITRPDIAATAPGESGRLGDGRRFRIRRLYPGDGLRLAACFARMSNDARQARFFGAKRRLTPAELRHFCSPDGWDHIALGALALGSGGADAELLGAVRCLRLPASRRTADLAIAVADDARGLRLGDALLAALTRQARLRGITNFHCEVLRTNLPMRGLAERFDGELTEHTEDTLVYRLPVAEPAVATETGGGAEGWRLPAVLDPIAVRHDLLDWLDGTAACGLAALREVEAGAIRGAERLGISRPLFADFSF